MKTKRVCRTCGEPYFAGTFDDPNCCRTCLMMENTFGGDSPHAGLMPYSRLKANADALAEALRELHDTQNGPPLARYEARWGAAMLKAQAALADYEGEKYV